MKKVTYTYQWDDSKDKHKGIFFVQDILTDNEIRDIIYTMLGFKLKIKTETGYVYDGYGTYEKVKSCGEDQNKCE